MSAFFDRDNLVFPLEIALSCHFPKDSQSIELDIPLSPITLLNPI
ncbi:unnamed protein product [Acidithrix sp. C25]|nr:unnamed protein product [Acidithrix sp. C25]